MKHKGFFRKIKSQAGETIAEVLVALLVSSVALVMLASMISSTNSLVTRSKSKMKDYYDENEKLEEQSAAPDASLKIQISSEDNIEMIVDDLPGYKNEILGKTVYAYGISSIGG